MTPRPFDTVTSLASFIKSMGADGVTGRMTKNLNLSMDEIGFTICETEKLTKSMGEDGGTERMTKTLIISMGDAGGTNCEALVEMAPCWQFATLKCCMPGLPARNGRKPSSQHGRSMRCKSRQPALDDRGPFTLSATRIHGHCYAV